MRRFIDLPGISSEPLDRMARGYEISQILFTAIEYDIFSLLKEPKTAKQVSEEIGTDPWLTEKFLDSLTALELLLKIHSHYANTKLAEIFLVKESAFYQGNLLRLRAKSCEDWSKLGQALRHGGIQRGGKEKAKIYDKDFALAHAEGAIHGDLHRAVSAIALLPEFKNATKLLDLGGGHGLYAIAFAQLNLNLDAFVFDLPRVTEIAKEFIKQYGMQQRVRVIPGDFTKDDLGNGYDIVFASDVTMSGILGNIYNALKDDGVLIYRRWTLNEDKTGPLTSVLFDLMLSIMRSEHGVYTLREYIDSLERAGFSVTRILDISKPSDPTKIIVAKKRVEIEHNKRHD